ncbi:MAG: ABC transporter substrate-binding protein, partial [Acidobacteriota bacterium]
VAAVSALFLVRRGSHPDPGRAAVSPASALVRGGELTASLRSEPSTYNRYVEASAPAEVLAMLTQAPLLRVNRTTDQLEPWLAESWTQSADGLTYTLKLRQGVTFSDGTPFTSADVLFSYRALYDPRANTVIAGDILVAGKPLVVEAPDPATVVLRFAGPFAAGLRLVDSVPILPRHKLEAALLAGKFAEAWGAATPPGDLAGLGPFVLAEHVPGERLVFVRNPHFWRKDAAGTQLPYLDKLTVRILPDQNAEALRMQTGEIDLMSNADIRPDDYATFKRIAAGGRLRLIDGGTSLDPNLLWFNLGRAGAADPRSPWLRRREFRLALSCVVDRQSIINTVYLGAGVAIYQPITPTNRTWYSPVQPACVHDAARARALFASAGLTDRNGDGMLEDVSGTPARFSIITQRGHTLRERTVAVLQEQLRQAGIAVDVVALDTKSIVQRWTAGDYDSIFYGVQASSTDPALSPHFWLSSGNFHFWNPRQAAPSTGWEGRMDGLFREQAVAAGLPERQRLVTEMQRLFVEELPGIYFVAPAVTIAVSERVANPSPVPQIPQLLWSADTLAVAAPRR